MNNIEQNNNRISFEVRLLYNVLFVKIGSKLLEMFAVEKGKGENTIATDRAQIGDRCAFFVLCSCLFLRVGTLRTHRSECVPSHSFRSRSGHQARGQLERNLIATESPEMCLFSSMLALIPQSGDFSLCIGRLGLPDRLPFSKPKVNWLLHTRSAFCRTPSGRLARSQLESDLTATIRSPQKSLFIVLIQIIERIFGI